MHTNYNYTKAFKFQDTRNSVIAHRAHRALDNLSLILKEPRYLLLLGSCYLSTDSDQIIKIINSETGTINREADPDWRGRANPGRIRYKTPIKSQIKKIKYSLFYHPFTN